MNSEDDYCADRYENRQERRSSRRTRRRSSAPRRRRGTGYDYYPRKTRRNKGWHNQNGIRIVTILFVVLIIGYEIFVFKDPISRKARRAVTSSRRSQTTNSSSFISPTITQERMSKPSPGQHYPLDQPTEQEDAASEPSAKGLKPTSGQYEQSQSPPPSPYPKSSQKISLESSSKGTDRITEVANVAADADAESEKGTSTEPLSKTTDKPKSSTKRIPASALRLESRAADEDVDVDNTPSQKTGSTQGAHVKRSVSRKGPDNRASPGANDNFWNWFQETKGNEKEGSSSIPCPEENKRLCQMFYKYLRKYKIRCVYDTSCKNNFNWIPDILRKAGNELWGFKYYCNIPNEEGLAEAKERLGSMPFVEFDDKKWWRTGFAEDTELLFSWDTLPHIAYGRVWNFFVKAKKQAIKYILIDNYPGILNDPSPKRKYLNIRKHPFRFPAAKEVVQNVTEPGETAKRQLLFYESSMLPENLQ